MSIKGKVRNTSLESISDNSTLIKNVIVTDSSKIGRFVSNNNPFTFDGLVLGICMKGSVRIKINFREYILEAHSAVTITPNCVIESCESSDDLQVHLLLISFDFLIGFPFLKEFNLLRSIHANPVLEISEAAIENLLVYYDLMVKKIKGKDHLFKNHIVRTLFFSMLLELAKLYHDRGDIKELETRVKSRGTDICDQFLKLLILHHRKERKAQFYADELFITTKYLSSTLKKHLGKTVNVLINEAVIARAKLLLKTTNKTVLEISEELNFSTPSFFGRYFKQYTSMTPMEYRESD